MNKREEFELECYFSKIQASFAKKFIITFFDLAYILIFNVPIFIMFAYGNPSDPSKIVEAFKKIVDSSSSISALRCLLFSFWMFAFLYVYFVLVPSKAEYQTFFSSNLGIRAVTLKDNLNYAGKVTQGQLFRANLIPVFLLPILNIIFFSIATIATIAKNEEGHKAFFSSSSEQVAGRKYGVALFRVLGTGAFFLQMFYLFTVGASKKCLNGFVKNNGIIWVDVERADLVMKSEDEAIPEKSMSASLRSPSRIAQDIVQQSKTLNVGAA